LLAEKQTGGDWRIKDLLLNIVFTIIHGELELIAPRLERSLKSNYSKTDSRIIG
jgi:hypothetical protein